MLSSNDWVVNYLPCAFNSLRGNVPGCRKRGFKRLAEGILNLSIFNRWEDWELARMRKQLRSVIGTAAEVVCSPSQCKGHTGLHRQSVLTRYVNALKSWNLQSPLVVVEHSLEANLE
jgi:hypothetical protein